MGIEPTRDFVEPHTGFEDQGRHQAASHLHVRPIVAALAFRGQRLVRGFAGRRHGQFSKGSFAANRSQDGHARLNNHAAVLGRHLSWYSP